MLIFTSWGVINDIMFLNLQILQPLKTAVYQRVAQNFRAKPGQGFTIVSLL